MICECILVFHPNENKKKSTIYDLQAGPQGCLQYVKNLNVASSWYITIVVLCEDRGGAGVSKFHKILNILYKKIFLQKRIVMIVLRQELIAQCRRNVP
jgi:hypothetical protein